METMNLKEFPTEPQTLSQVWAPFLQQMRQGVTKAFRDSVVLMDARKKAMTDRLCDMGREKIMAFQTRIWAMQDAARHARMSARQAVTQWVHRMGESLRQVQASALANMQRATHSMRQACASTIRSLTEPLQIGKEHARNLVALGEFKALQLRQDIGDRIGSARLSALARFAPMSKFMRDVSKKTVEPLGKWLAANPTASAQAQPQTLAQAVAGGLRKAKDAAHHGLLAVFKQMATNEHAIEFVQSIADKQRDWTAQNTERHMQSCLCDLSQALMRNDNASALFAAAEILKTVDRYNRLYPGAAQTSRWLNDAMMIASLSGTPLGELIANTFSDKQRNMGLGPINASFQRLSENANQSFASQEEKTFGSPKEKTKTASPTLSLFNG